MNLKTLLRSEEIIFCKNFDAHWFRYTSFWQSSTSSSLLVSLSNIISLMFISRSQSTHLPWLWYRSCFLSWFLVFGLFEKNGSGQWSESSWVYIFPGSLFSVKVRPFYWLSHRFVTSHWSPTSWVESSLFMVMDGELIQQAKIKCYFSQLQLWFSRHWAWHVPFNVLLTLIMDWDLWLAKMEDINWLLTISAVSRVRELAAAYDLASIRPLCLYND